MAKNKAEVFIRAFLFRIAGCILSADELDKLNVFSCFKIQIWTLHVWCWSGLVSGQWRGAGEPDKSNSRWISSVHPADGSAVWCPLLCHSGCCHQPGRRSWKPACQPASQWVTPNVTATIEIWQGSLSVGWVYHRWNLYVEVTSMDHQSVNNVKCVGLGFTMKLRNMLKLYYQLVAGYSASVLQSKTSVT